MQIFNPKFCNKKRKDLPEASKILHNGTFYILRGNKVYSVSGQEVKTL